MPTELEKPTETPQQPLKLGLYLGAQNPTNTRPSLAPKPPYAAANGQGAAAVLRARPGLPARPPAGTANEAAAGSAAPAVRTTHGASSLITKPRPVLASGLHSVAAAGTAAAGDKPAAAAGNGVAGDAGAAAGAEPKYDFSSAPRPCDFKAMSPDALEFIYLRHAHAEVRNPYNLVIVTHADIKANAASRNNYYTMSVKGVTHFAEGSGEFITLEQFEREYFLYRQLLRFRTFVQFRLWKAFKIWRRFVSSRKARSAKEVLQKSLFMLNPVFRVALVRMRTACHGLQQLRLHAVERGQLYGLPQLVSLHAARHQDTKAALEQFEHDIVAQAQEACVAAMQRMEDQLLGVKANAAASGNGPPAGLGGGSGGGVSLGAPGVVLGGGIGDAMFPDGPLLPPIAEGPAGGPAEGGEGAAGAAEAASGEGAGAGEGEEVKAPPKDWGVDGGQFLQLAVQLQAVSPPQPSARGSGAVSRVRTMRNPDGGAEGAGVSAHNSSSQVFITQSKSLARGLLAAGSSGSVAGSMNGTPGNLPALSHELVLVPPPGEFVAALEKIHSTWAGQIQSVARLLTHPNLQDYMERPVDAGFTPDMEGFTDIVLGQAYSDSASAVLGRLRAVMEDANGFKATFEPIKSSVLALKPVDEAGLRLAWESGRRDLEAYRRDLTSLRDQLQTVMDVPQHKQLNVLRVELSELVAALRPAPERALASLSDLLPRLAFSAYNSFISAVHSATRRLNTMPTSADELSEFLHFLAECERNKAAMDREYDAVVAHYDLAEDFDIRIPDMQAAAYATLDRDYAALRDAMWAADSSRERLVETYGADLSRAVDAIAKQLAGISMQAQHDMILDERSDPDVVQADKIQQHQRTFRLEETRFPELEDCYEDVALRHRLWTSVRGWAELTQGWLGERFDLLQPGAMEEAIGSYSRAVFKMERGLVPNKIVPKLRAGVNYWRDLVPLVSALRNPFLKERHWVKVNAAVGSYIDRNEELTLQGLLDINLLAAREAVSLISTEATQEAALEAMLDKVADKWRHVELSLKPYKALKETYVLGGVDEVLAVLEDSSMVMATISASRYVAGVEKLDRQLRLFGDTLDEWLDVQRQWLALEPILTAADIQRQLPSEARAFAAVDRQLKEVNRKAKDRPNALQAGTQPGLLEQLRRCNEALEGVAKNLEAYLEAKRTSFPRFYFLSNDELLQILSQARNPQAVQPHLQKCFDGIRSLDFGEEGRTNDILAMVSAEGERIGLSKNLKASWASFNAARGSVEQWLGSVEAAMRMAVRGQARRAHRDYVTGPGRWDWVRVTPAQLVVVVSNIHWCRAVEACLSRANGDPLTALGELHTLCASQLSDLTSVVRAAGITPLERKVLVTLITTDVHNRDVLEGCTRAAAAEEEGAAPFRRTRLWCAKSMPSTGKTETVKDLAKALGVQCVVFNCGDNLDFRFMGKFFSGLAQAGAWACFDEFNRIDTEVLSVVAQQLQAIQTALRAGVERFVFEGNDIRLLPSCGVFVTMNPGYAGRTELPDNLQALFRPMAMMVPDYALVAEVMLFSEGFEGARSLSRKMVQLYKLASEQLSQQDHYDFGMRALKSVLVTAGSLKRGSTGLPEETVLIRAMRESNIPKFLSEDARLFDAIVCDLFPGTDLPEQRNEELHGALVAACGVLGLQPVPPFVSKAIQLWDTFHVRFGAMLVGPPGGGKTCIYRTLAEAITRLSGVTTFQAAISEASFFLGELYGSYNTATNEWQDGLASCIIRGAVVEGQSNPDLQWVVFDGPVDTVWVENMNTVLDDNCMLCLPNGERIKLDPASMRVLFEVADLVAASPATVSRCGMVYVTPDDMGWRPYVSPGGRGPAEALGAEASGSPPLARRPSAGVLQYLQGLFDKFLDPLLAHARKRGEAAVATCEVALVSATCSLLQTLLLSTQLQGHPGAEGASLRKHGAGFGLRAAATTLLGAASVAASHAAGGLGGAAAGGQSGAAASASAFATASTPYKDPLLDLTSEEPSETTQVALNYIFAFAAVWGVGGSLSPACWEAFDGAAKDLFEGTANYPGGSGTVFDYHLDYHKNFALTPWEAAVPAYAFRPEVRYFDILVPTADTTRYGALLSCLLAVNRPVLLTGPSGSGKSALVRSCLSRLQAGGGVIPTTVYFSAQTSAATVQAQLEGQLEKKRKRRFGAPAGRRLLLFVDDVNLPARDAASGAQPPIELLRHLQDFSEVALRTIFGAIMGGFLDLHFPPDVRTRMLRPLVDTSVEVYSHVCAELLPTPAKSHYTFSLRDVSKAFQGMLAIRPNQCGPGDPRGTLMRLWVHEHMRVYHDRGWVEAAMRRLLVRPGDFLKRGGTRDERVYAEVRDVPRLGRVLEGDLDEYNAGGSGPRMDLVLFMDAVEHITRIARILRQPRGNAMLVGVGGSGKQSLARFAAFLADTQVFTLELSRGYGVVEFREDIKKLYRLAGIEGKPVAFLLPEQHIVLECFVEDVSNLGLEDTREAMWRAFVDRVRDNLHLVLALSPVGEAFRERCRRFPSLLAATSVDWFSEWPQEALMSVSTRFLEQQELGGPGVMKALAQACVDIHTSVVAAASRYYLELRRRYYETAVARERLLGGVSKLTATNTTVEEMRTALRLLQPVLADKTEATQRLLEQVTHEQYEAEHVRAAVAGEEADVKAQAAKLAALKDEAQADLEEVLPALEAAERALSALNKTDIIEIKTFTKPPALVQTTMEAVCILLQERADWDTAKRLLGEATFIKRLMEYDRDNIPDKVVRSLKRVIDDPTFTPDQVAKQSKAAQSLCLWVRAMDTYARVIRVVEPKRAALATAQERLGAMNGALLAKQRQLGELEARVATLQEQLQSTQEELHSLQHQAELSQRRLVRAEKLTGALADESVRWAAQAERMTTTLHLLVGDVFLAAAAIRDWGMQGLPTDSLSVDNGVLPVLLEDVGEGQLDPALEPLLTKATYTQGTRLLLKLGDVEVDYDPRFRLYLATRLPNPHYLPEVCIKVNLINFTVTPKGLEDQLLGDVVRHERPDLEEAKDRLVVSLSADKRQLGELEDRILQLLQQADAGGLLDDEQLIATLNDAKQTSGIIATRVAEAEATERAINEAREVYRPVPARGSLLYFVTAELSAIDPMYQTSLAAFVRMFGHCLDAAPRADDLAARLRVLMDTTTDYVYRSVCRGLFDSHKLLYSFLISAAVERQAGLAGVPEGDEGEEGGEGPVLARSISQVLPEGGGADVPARLTAFQMLLLVKVFCEGRLLAAIRRYVSGCLGPAFTEPPPASLPELFTDSSPATPIIFILSQGAVKAGDWVCLQNCHLAASWMPRLERLVEELQARYSKQIQFSNRLGLKLGSPDGVRANLLRIYGELSDAERRRFGPLGWNVRYEFSDGDLSAAMRTLQMFLVEGAAAASTSASPGAAGAGAAGLTGMRPAAGSRGGSVFDATPPWDLRSGGLSAASLGGSGVGGMGGVGGGGGVGLSPGSSHGDIPWDALQYVTGDIVYGGRVTDENDRRLLSCLLRRFYTPALQESRTLLDTVLSIQPRVVASTAADGMGAPATPAHAQAADPLASVGGSAEMERLNALRALLAKSLDELGRALRGLAVSSAELEAMATALLNNQVPPAWRRAAYPSTKPLASWVNDFRRRVEHLRTWLTRGQPPAFWLPGLFFPQGFITAVLQNHARRTRVPIDRLAFDFKVLSPEADKELVEAVDTHAGAAHRYQCPLYKTSVRAGVLSTTGQSTNFVLHLGLGIPDATDPDFWVMQGVAALCALDD
eukprot:XP_001696272.1 dynein heavy chain 3 [Chlamydomonas reinhardtii]